MRRPLRAVERRKTERKSELVGEEGEEGRKTRRPDWRDGVFPCSAASLSRSRPPSAALACSFSCSKEDNHDAFSLLASRTSPETNRKGPEKHDDDEGGPKKKKDAGPVQLQPQVASNFFFASAFYRGLKIRDWYRCSTSVRARRQPPLRSRTTGCSLREIRKLFAITGLTHASM